MSNTKKAKLAIGNRKQENQVKKIVTLKIEWIKNEKGGLKEKRTWVQEVVN